MEAAAELERQREQEEWDRAFEEELVQTGLPEDVVAACVYQILGVRQLGVGVRRRRCWRSRFFVRCRGYCRPLLLCFVGAESRAMGCKWLGDVWRVHVPRVV